MSLRRIRVRWAAPLCAALATLAALAIVCGGKATAAPAAGCTAPAPVRHIYDCTGLLAPAEVADLERRAAAVERAGAPTVVYLQARDASYDQTLQDAQDLMNRWNVQSSPDAHDGFVMVLNLKPGDLRHGEVALFAGAKHYNGGNLPQAELSHIYTTVMLPRLQTGATAAGIGAGLDAVAHDLRYGPPTNLAQVVASIFGRLPYTLLALLFVVSLDLLHRRARQTHLPDESLNGPAASPPSDLAPALVGALVTGRVRDEQIEATILDFARRGLLEIEPSGAEQGRIRLLSEGKELTGYERAVWSTLSAETDGDNIVFPSHLPAVRMRWGWAEDLLRQELTRRGWYDPKAALRRRPLYLAGGIGISAILIGIIVAAVAQEGWALIGMLIFLAATIASFVLGRGVPDTSAEGQLVAAPWRNYLTSIKAGRHITNVDAALPYAVAAARGYSPAWSRGGDVGQAESSSSYRYWTALHSGMYPVSSGGTSGGGFAGGGGGGAAAGGGGAGGAF